MQNGVLARGGGGLSRKNDNAPRPIIFNVFKGVDLIFGTLFRVLCKAHNLWKRILSQKFKKAIDQS